MLIDHNIDPSEIEPDHARPAGLEPNHARLTECHSRRSDSCSYWFGCGMTAAMAMVGMAFGWSWPFLLPIFVTSVVVCIRTWA